MYEPSLKDPQDKTETIWFFTQIQSQKGILDFIGPLDCSDSVSFFSVSNTFFILENRRCFDSCTKFWLIALHLYLLVAEIPLSFYAASDQFWVFWFARNNPE